METWPVSHIIQWASFHEIIPHIRETNWERMNYHEVTESVKNVSDEVLEMRSVEGLSYVRYVVCMVIMKRLPAYQISFSMVNKRFSNALRNISLSILLVLDLPGPIKSPQILSQTKKPHLYQQEVMLRKSFDTMWTPDALCHLLGWSWAVFLFCDKHPCPPMGLITSGFAWGHWPHGLQECLNWRFMSITVHTSTRIQSFLAELCCDGETISVVLISCELLAFLTLVSSLLSGEDALWC